MYARAAKAYATVDLESMPKTKIVERLFERFGRDVAAAKTAIGSRDIHGKAAAIDHATQIAVQLRMALDHAAAPELCANLDALYHYVITKLAEGNLSLAAAPLEEAARVMAELGDAFQRAHLAMK